MSLNLITPTTSVSGNATTSVSGDATISVSGNATTSVSGDATARADSSRFVTPGYNMNDLLNKLGVRTYDNNE